MGIHAARMEVWYILMINQMKLLLRSIKNKMICFDGHEFRSLGRSIAICDKFGLHLMGFYSTELEFKYFVLRNLNFSLFFSFLSLCLVCLVLCMHAF